MQIDKVTELLTTADDKVRKYREAMDAHTKLEAELGSVRDQEQKLTLELAEAHRKLRNAARTVQEHFAS